jgi:hypothetical protein
MDNIFNNIESDNLSDAKEDLTSLLNAKVADAIDAMRSIIAGQFTHEAFGKIVDTTGKEHKSSMGADMSKHGLKVGDMLDRMMAKAKANTKVVSAKDVLGRKPPSCSNEAVEDEFIKEELN